MIIEMSSMLEGITLDEAQRELLFRLIEAA